MLRCREAGCSTCSLLLLFLWLLLRRRGLVVVCDCLPMLPAVARGLLGCAAGRLPLRACLQCWGSVSMLTHVIAATP